MASSKRSVEYATSQMQHAGTVTFRAMFGEYGIYCDGKFAAVVCDDQLFVKPTEPGRAFAGPVEEGQPYPGAKMWMLISEDRMEDAEWLSALIRKTAAALPAPKVRAGKRVPPKTSTKKAK